MGWRGLCEERRELPRAWPVPEGSGGSTQPLSPAGVTPGEMEMRKGKALGKGEECGGKSEETALWGGGRELQASGQGLPPQETWWGRCALVHAWERVLILPLFLTILIYFDWQ